jgi:hypothetical protein
VPGEMVKQVWRRQFNNSPNASRAEVIVNDDELHSFQTMSPRVPQFNALEKLFLKYS